MDEMNPPIEKLRNNAMTSRLAAFALVVLSTLILAQQVCAADVIRHRQGTSNDYENCFIANTP